jgi:hypothetical protein
MDTYTNGETLYPVFAEPEEGFKFVHIPPGELPKHWPWVLKGLAAVKERVGDLVSYTPMHIRNSIVQNQSQLFIVTDDGVPAAFTVVTLQTDPFLNVPTVLHVWILYAEPRQHKAAKFAIAEIIKFGKSLCLSKMHFLSPRGDENVWMRLAGVKGRATMTIYEVDLFEE